MNKSEHQQEIAEKMKSTASIGLLITTLILFCTFWVWLWYKDAPIDKLGDYMGNAGPIGDAVGGLTAPIINLTAAVLVYLSFQEQLRANNIQIRNFRKDHQQAQLAFISPQISEILSEINSLLDTISFTASLKEKFDDKAIGKTFDKEIENYSDKKEFAISIAAKVLTPLAKKSYYHRGKLYVRYYSYDEKKLYKIYLNTTYVLSLLEVLVELTKVNSDADFNLHKIRVKIFYESKLQNQLFHFQRALTSTENPLFKPFAEDFKVKFDKIEMYLNPNKATV
ncbi:hypothetical protein H9Q13_01175 [Pontibacter sp. JH31]|uniref:Phage abortive infection protein n=1 Tax=Pontibacter aquaedesilientis TaxID=2766980 RepID=A0ABR7XBS9_9BACT|nr:hypothetical protein [Pontibacter aquaedesilientis]MBD1395762.1 hypothetical protein [Pontibacter aquaedesilientis]